MRCLVVAVLIFASLLLPGRPAAALGAEKPWFGGLYNGFCGFSEQTGLPAGEYLELGLFAEPLAIHLLNPALFCGFLLPISPANSQGINIQIAGELTVVEFPAPFLKKRFYFSSYWSPAVGAEYLFTLDFSAARFSLVIAPLRFRAADALFTFGALQLFLAQGQPLQGWGFTLFKAALFLF